LQSGSTLEKAFAELAGLKISGDLGKTVQRWFSSCAALGWFCGLEQASKTKRANYDN